MGRKIGFTNRELWREYGVYESIWAFVYDTTVVHLSASRSTCGFERFAEPRERWRAASRSTAGR